MGTKDLSDFKKNCQKIKGVLLFEDEASFRQDPTLIRTWSRVGLQPLIPTYGQRNTQHVYGAVSIPNGFFSYRFSGTFNGVTYKAFLDTLIRKFYPRKIFLIQDNASYHKNPDILSWFDAHRKEIEPWFLPPYSPNLNAIESLWKYARSNGTHNRFFAHTHNLVSSLKKVFRNIQYHPDLIKGYLAPYN